MLRIDAER